MKTTGLTLGKFAPFHKGHQYMIETAIREMDDVIIVIYDAPEVTGIPLNIRASWIRTLYPNVEVIEGVDGPSVTGDSSEIKKIQEDYISGLLKGRKITHFYSSEFYGDHMSQSLGALNREVDRARTVVPISGTLVRENVFLHKNYLSPVVYKDFVVNVVFLGAPFTGKTTLAKKLSEEYKTVWMPEYGREYWEQNQSDRRLTLDQLTEIAEGHLLQEDQQLYKANQYLFTDTSAITTYMFSLYYHNEVSDKLKLICILRYLKNMMTFFCLMEKEVNSLLQGEIILFSH
ncbi:cytidyltransferase [Sporocytophaga myxococcoides]|uniref:Cytidyltransferase n=1 Tax=Sporocytophaga myxococcoides TaxID=153721 RepID=A0A098LFJ5_9BACT|nr:AAA family ATPase [Sporocytophaga myxococcoides]GAL85725.1 cytidyltransferase [Sporocytophaga myxococcoides]